MNDKKTGTKDKNENVQKLKDMLNEVEKIEKDFKRLPLASLAYKIGLNKQHIETISGFILVGLIIGLSISNCKVLHIHWILSILLSILELFIAALIVNGVYMKIKFVLFKKKFLLVFRDLPGLISNFENKEDVIPTIMSTSNTFQVKSSLLHELHRSNNISTRLRNNARCSEWFYFKKHSHGVFEDNYYLKKYWKIIAKNRIIPSDPPEVRKGVLEEYKRLAQEGRERERKILDEYTMKQPDEFIEEAAVAPESCLEKATEKKEEVERETTVKSVELYDVPKVGFKMTRERWSGLACLVGGGAAIAWQLYELSNQSGLTVWVISFIPIPVIVPGIILVVVGLLMFLFGRER